MLSYFFMNRMVLALRVCYKRMSHFWYRCIIMLYIQFIFTKYMYTFCSVTYYVLWIWKRCICHFISGIYTLHFQGNNIDNHKMCLQLSWFKVINRFNAGSNLDVRFRRLNSIPALKKYKNVYTDIYFIDINKSHYRFISHRLLCIMVADP